MTPVYKLTIEIQVLTEHPSFVTNASLASLAEDLDNGDSMGIWDVVASRELTRDEVVQECHLMGGDPMFFLGADMEDDDA